MAEGGDAGTPALYFSAVIAYIVPVFSFITERSRESLLQLRPALNLDEPAFESALGRIDSASGRFVLLHLLGGTLMGLGHITVIGGSVQQMVSDMMHSRVGFVSTVGTVMVWVVMTTVIAMLIRQAVLFARLGSAAVRISLFNSRKLVPFARVSTTSTLALIGGLALSFH